MFSFKRYCTPLVMAAVALAVSACQESVTEPDTNEPSFDHLVAGEQVCETVDFNGFEHGEAINSLSAFDATLAVNTIGDGGFSEDQARGYDTDNVGGPDFDLEWDGDDARCPDCEGLGIVMVIGDNRGFEAEGDSPDGGTVTITGFPSEGETFVDAFKGLDHEPDEENAIELFVDGTSVGATTGLGDGTVETVDTSEDLIDTEIEFVFRGSGAVDDLEICHTPPEERGDEGCTPGYWRQSHHFDSWPSEWLDSEGQPDVDFSDIFDSPGSLALERPESGDINDLSLLDALVLNGGGLNALARHAAAAALNANSDGVEYFYTLSEVEDLVDGALSSGDYESAKDDLEEANEELCPLD